MVWTIALMVFLAQLICCVYVKRKVLKYLPTLLVAAVMSFTVLDGTLGAIDAVMLVAETKVILMGGLALAIYHLALWIKNRK